jgi:hypothetical protein
MGDALWNENKTGPDSSWKNEIYKCDVANKGRLLRCCATVGNFSAHRSGALTLCGSFYFWCLQKIILFRVKWIFDTCLSGAVTFFQPIAQTHIARIQ